ncbi:MAG: hypothetical protein K1X29_01615 [Bdellovibrionales bacterium]|nr:hypothetical protein [Bdellovibrionales bacterium]
MNSKFFLTLPVYVTLIFANNVSKCWAEETTQEKIENKTNEARDKVKENYRDLKDKECEYVNGKMKCLGKKFEHKYESARDKAETKKKELKNKID